MALSWPSYPYQPQQWQVLLSETIADTEYTTRTGAYGGEKGLPAPGALLIEQASLGMGPYKDVHCQGLCFFRWAVNRNGSTLSEGALAKFRANQAVTADAAGTTTTFTDSSQFTADEEVFGLLHILDDAGGAGAAPEGEMGLIVANTADTLTIQTAETNRALTAATASGDTGVIHYDSHVIAAASGDQAYEVAGVALADVADNYWGWFCCYGKVRALIQASTALTAEDAIIAHTGRVTISSSSDDDKIIGAALVAVSNDIASDRALVFIDVMHPVIDTA